MRRKMSWALVILGIVALSSAYGCTGTRVIVKPDLTSIKPPTTKDCGKVAVTEINADGSASKIPGASVLAFAKYLEHSGLFDEVYCPTRPNDIFSLSIESKFSVKRETNNGLSAAKAFITGLSLFVLEPIFWYEYNYVFSGHVDIIKESKTVASYDAKTDADLSSKLLSLDDLDVLQNKLWPAGIETTFAQLLRDIETYCKQGSDVALQ